MSRYGLDDEPEDEGSIIVSQNNSCSNENVTFVCIQGLQGCAWNGILPSRPKSLERNNRECRSALQDLQDRPQQQ